MEKWFIFKTQKKFPLFRKVACVARKSLFYFFSNKEYWVMTSCPDSDFYNFLAVSATIEKFFLPSQSRQEKLGSTQGLKVIFTRIQPQERTLFYASSLQNFFHTKNQNVNFWPKQFQYIFCSSSEHFYTILRLFSENFQTASRQSYVRNDLKRTRAEKWIKIKVGKISYPRVKKAIFTRIQPQKRISFSPKCFTPKSKWQMSSYLSKVDFSKDEE